MPAAGPVARIPLARRSRTVSESPNRRIDPAATGSFPLGLGVDPVGRSAHEEGRGGRDGDRRRQAFAARLTRPVVLALVLLGPLLAVATWFGADAYDHRNAREEFDDALVEREQALQQQLLSFVEGLYYCRGLFDASEKVTGSEFGLFTGPARARHPAMLAIEWSPRARTRSVPTGDTPEGDPPEEPARVPGLRPGDRYPLRFSEPTEPRGGLVAYDQAAHPDRREAMEKAALTGGAVLSAPHPLVEAEGFPLGAWLALAVYDTEGEDGVGTEPRGFVSVAFRMDAFLEAVCERCGEAVLPTMSLRLTDGPTGRSLGASPPDALAAGAAPPAAAPPGVPAVPVPPDPAEARGIVAEREMEAAGRTWLLRATPTAAFFGGRHALSPWVPAWIVFLVWEAFAGCLLVLAREWRQHALRRQGEFVRHVLRSLGEGVVVSDRHGKVRLTNRAARELAGLNPSIADSGYWPSGLALIHPDGRTPYRQEQLPLTRALRGEAVDEEALLVRGHGETPRWVTVSARPLSGEDDELLGGVVVLRDDTARKRSEEDQRRLQARDVEMRLASEVQQRLYPPHPPAIPGMDVAGTVIPAEETCGDYFDFVTRPDGRIGLVIGDVSGHGLGPALVMAEVRAYLRSLAHEGIEPGHLLKELNGHLVADLGGDLFVSLLLVDLDPATGTLAYASAGQTPGLVVDGGSGDLKGALTVTGPPLGLFANREFRTRNGTVLDVGDVLVLATDGATECPAPDGSMFEETGILEVVRRHRSGSAAEILTAIRDALAAFSEIDRRRDDVTLVVVKRVAPSVS